MKYFFLCRSADLTSLGVSRTAPDFTSMKRSMRESFLGSDLKAIRSCSVRN